MARPAITDYDEFFSGYITEVSEEDVPAAFANQLLVIHAVLSSINEQQSLNSYAPGKWTIREMLQHMIDAERIFAYRALCIARQEKASLPSFDENEYAANSDANKRHWKSLVNEFMNTRLSTQDLFETFTESMLQQKGIANKREITVLSLGYIIVGHVYHHIKVLKDKYL